MALPTQLGKSVIPHPGFKQRKFCLTRWRWRTLTCPIRWSFFVFSIRNSTHQSLPSFIWQGWAPARLRLEMTLWRVILSDAAKEIRRCLHCQKYGHGSKFCTAVSPRCGYCAGDHQMADCASLSNSPRYAIYKSAHQAGHHSCTHQQAAVKAYKHRMILLWMHYHLAFAAGKSSSVSLSR